RTGYRGAGVAPGIGRGWVNGLGGGGGGGSTATGAGASTSRGSSCCATLSSSAGCRSASIPLASRLPAGRGTGNGSYADGAAVGGVPLARKKSSPSRSPDQTSANSTRPMTKAPSTSHRARGEGRHEARSKWERDGLVG